MMDLRLTLMCMGTCEIKTSIEGSDQLECSILEMKT